MDEKPQAAIIKALVAAQAELPNPKFDSENPHFRNRYASLAGIRDTVMPVLAKHGLAYTQTLTSDPVANTVSVETALIHESGERIVFLPFTLPVSASSAQGYGSAATYARRYSLQAVLGIAAEEDDDAEEATKPPKAQGARSKAERQPGHTTGEATPVAGQSPHQRRFMAVLRQLVTYQAYPDTILEASEDGGLYRRQLAARLLGKAFAELPEHFTGEEWAALADRLTMERNESFPTPPSPGGPSAP